MKKTIRQVRKGDDIPLAKIIRKVFEEHDAPRHGTVYSDPTTNHLFELFQIPGSILWVAEINNNVVGCCGIYPTKGLNEKYAELVKFYLARESRGLGIGRDLMVRCVKSARELGYTHLYLESLPHFAKAVNMYEKQGFVRLDKPLGNSGHNSCTIWMLKKL
jgi:putative acetyltransferase